MRLLNVVAALVWPIAASADYLCTNLSVPSDTGTVLEPVLYFADTCDAELLYPKPLMSPTPVSDVVLAFRESPRRVAAACVTYLIIDQWAYRLSPTAVVQGYRNALSVFSLNLQGCVRSNGSPASSTGPLVLQGQFNDLELSVAAKVRYGGIRGVDVRIAVNTPSGDVKCNNAIPIPPPSSLSIFKNGFE